MVVLPATNAARISLVRHARVLAICAIRPLIVSSTRARSSASRSGVRA